MAFEMIDRDQRLARGVRQRLAGDQPDHHPPISPGPAVAAIASTSASVTPASASAARDQRLQHLDMRARRDLRHDAAIGRVRRFLPGQPVRQDAPVAGDQRRRGLVAGGFEAEDQHRLRLYAARARLVDKAMPDPG